MSFVSRRNMVAMENGEVVKRHYSTAALMREVEALESLAAAGLAVPKLISSDHNILKMEYVPGSIYLEHVDCMTLKKATSLSRWLANYHRITGFIKADVNLRNFIWTGTTCVGIDFEDPPLRGELELCLGKVLAFAVTYTPAFTSAKARCSAFLLQAFLEFGSQQKAIKRAYLQELQEMNLRRKNARVDITAAALFFDQSLQKEVLFSE